MAQRFYDEADQYLNQKHGNGTSGTTAQNTGAGRSMPQEDAADRYLQAKQERAQARARVQAIEAAQKQIRENKQNRAYQTQGGKDYVRQYTGGSRNTGRAPIDPMTITPGQAQILTPEERDTYKAQYDRINAQKNTPVIPALARETEARMEKPKFSADPEKEISVYSKAIRAMAQKGTAAAVYGDEKGYSQAVEDYNATRQEQADTVRPVYNRLKTELKGTVTEEQWPDIQRRAKLLEQAFTESGDANGAAFAKNLQQFETANQWNAAYRATVQTIPEAKQAVENAKKGSAEEYALARAAYAQTLALRAQELPDFEEKSKYISTANGQEKHLTNLPGMGYYYDQTGYDDVLYDAVNGDKAAQELVRSNELAVSYSPQKYNQWFRLPEKTKKIYNYIHATEGTDAAYDYLESLVSKEYSPMEAAIRGMGEGLGLSAAVGAVASLGGKATGNYEPQKYFRGFYTDDAAARQQHEAIYDVGQVAGSLMLTMAVGKGIGSAAKGLGITGATAIPAKLADGGAKLLASRTAVKAGTNALTFALSTAIRGSGQAATGMMTGADYLKAMGTSAAGAVAGSIAGELASTGVASILMKNGWVTAFGEFVRNTAASTAFAFANIGTNYIASGRKPEKGEVAKDLVAAFFFSMLQGGIETMQTVGASREQADAMFNKLRDNFNRLSDAGLSYEQKVELAKQVTEYIQELRRVFGVVYLPGQQDFYDDTFAALDGIEAVMRSYGEINAFYANYSAQTVYPGNLLTDGTAMTGAGEDGTSPLAPDTDPAQVQEMAAMIQTSIQQGVKDAGISTQSQDVPVSSGTEQTEVQPRTEIDWVGNREQPVQTQAATVSSGTENTGVQHQAEIDWIGNREQPGQVQAVQETAEAAAQTAAQQQITGRQAAGEAVDGKNEKGGMTDGGTENRQRQAASGLTAEEPDSSKQQISNDNLRRALAQEGEPYAETGTESITDGGQRDAGLGTGGQAGAVGESTEGQLAGGRAPTDDAHKRIAIASLQTERKSPREIGVKGGGSYKTLRVVEDETLFTSDMQQAVNDARDHGDSIVFFAGKLEVYNQYKQGYTSVDGLRQVDEHGQVRYYIKADSMIRSPGQLYRHEVFHDIVAKNLGLWQEIADYMQEHFTQNQLARMLGGYVRSYDGIYGEDLLAYLEEFMADGYAEMQRANVDIRPAKEALQNFKPQLVKEREKGQISQAVRDTRGSPAGKYSANEDYLLAVQAGDMDAAQEMVMQAAREAMPDTKILNEDGELLTVYHGTEESFNEFDMSKKRANMDIQGAFFTPWELDASGYGSNVRGFYLNITNPASEAQAYRALNLFKGQNNAGIKARKHLERLGYDGVNNENEEFIAFRPEQIKSADPVTYDENGEVIPLSERFNENKTDIRYSVAEDEEVSSGTEQTKGQQQTEIDWVGNREQPVQTQTEKVSSKTEKKGVQPKEETEAQEEKQEAKPEKKPVRKEETKTAGTEKGKSDLEKMAGLALEKKKAYADKKTVSQLKGVIKSAEENLRSFTLAKKAGLQSQVMERMEADARETLTVLKEALEKKSGDLDAKRERQKKVNEEKIAARKEAELQEQTPRQARKELTQDVLNLFSIQAGKRSAMQKVVWDFADKLLRQGTLTQEDRNELFSQMLENGVEIDQPESYYEDIRRTISGARIYVSQEVRDEFGDDWESFRKRAWGNRIYLTNSRNDQGVDVLWQELSSMFPGSFDAEETDLRLMLEQTVQLAEEGKAEHISLTEMLNRNERRYGQSVDDQLDAMQERLDGLLDKFAEKAKLELETKRQSTMKLIRQREHYRDMIEREAKKRSERETRNKVMRDIQSLWKKRTKAPPEIKAEIEKTLKNIDTVARSISIRGIEDCQELARQYRQAADDPNFIRSPYVEERLERLKETQLDDMEIEDVAELGKTVCAISQSLQNWNKMLADEKNAKISDIAGKARAEISAADGTKGGAMNKFLSENHLAPRRFLEHLGGWKRGGAMELLAKELEDGELRQLRYLNQATRIFDKFLEDKSNSKWLKTASGKNSEWIKVSVPDGTGTREFEITPMMRVQFLLHCRNEDNLRHIRDGGIVIPDKELYKKGDIGEALARGQRIKMEPSIVRAIVKDCTEKELEFARLLEKYYNGFSKDHINEVSMQLDGFERAGGDHYCHIKVDKNFLEKNPGKQQDISLEHIGSIVNPRTHSGAPIILQDATEALMEHMEQISKYYGLALAIHDFNGVMNYTFHEEGAGGAFDTSVSEVLQQKWGSGAQKYLDKLIKDLQEPGGKSDQVSELLNKIKGNLAGATLMFNPSVAISQAFSYPAILQTMGLKPTLYGLQFWKRADKKIIERYTPLLWYRNQGNSTQELGDYIKEQGLEKKLPFLLNWIQKVDTMTVGRIWVAAEYYVSQYSKLEPGTKAEIDAGTDLYYQKVAEIFNRAVLDTQPNYTTFERPQILRAESDLTRALTMFKTVPLAYYNMTYEAVGRLRADASREKQTHSAENKENLKQSRRYFAWTVMGLTAANLGYVALKALVKGITFRGKKYQDEEGEYTAESVLSRLGLDMLETTAGSVIGGAELVQMLETVVLSMNDKKYSFYGSEVTALKFLNDLGESTVKVFTSLAKEDYKGGLDAIKGLAQSIAMGFGGVPAQNVETYLLALTRWIAPEWYEKYNNFFDEVEKSEISEENGRFQNAAIRVLMDNRTEDLSDETIEELQRLWNAGEHAALPSAVPNQISMTVDGTEQETALDAKMKKAYRESWSKTVSSAMEKLMASETYINADDKGKAGLLQRMYEFAGQTAKGTVLEGYETDKWVLTGQALMDAGAPLEDYIEYRYVISADDVKAEQKYEALEATGWNDEQKGILWRDEMASDKQKDAVEEAAKVGLSLGAFYGYAYETYGESNSEKLKALKGKEWSEEQKESVWLNLLADENQTEKYQNLKDAGLSWSEAVKVMDIGKTTDGMTDEEEAKVQARWDELAEAPTKRLVNSKEFKNASDEMQTAYLDKLNTYAKEIAKSEILKNYELKDWVKCGKEVIGAGVPLDEYAVYAANCSDKKLYEKCEVLNNTGWNQKQKLLAVKYMSDSAYKSASAGAAFNVDISNYLKGISAADTNGNGSITQAEAADFIDTLNIGLEDKAYLWQMLCPSSKSKKNPYSSRYGQMIWEYMHRDED